MEKESEGIVASRLFAKEEVDPLGRSDRDVWGRIEAAQTGAQRVQAIVEIIGTGRWVEGVTTHELAEMWGVGPSRVHTLVGEARRWFTRTLTEEEVCFYRRQAVGRLERLWAMAMEQSDVRAGAAIIKLEGQIVGYLTTHKPTGNSGGSVHTDWTIDQMNDYALSGKNPNIDDPSDEP